MNTSMMYQNSPPAGYREDTTSFTVDCLGSGMVAKQITNVVSSTAYILKDIEVFFPTALNDAYIDLNTAATAVEATKIIGRRDYQTGSFIHFDGNENGRIGGVLTALPYVQLYPGVGSDNQTGRVMVHYYYLA